MLAMVANDYAGILTPRGAFGYFASKLAPTKGMRICIEVVTVRTRA
jgi:hypothetical protein